MEAPSFNCLSVLPVRESFHRLLQLLFAFALRPREDALCDWLPRLRIDARRVAPFPATVFAFADVAFPVCPFFRHLCSPFRFGNTNNYHGRERKSSKFLKISDIFQGFPFQEKSLFFVYCGAVFASVSFHLRPSVVYCADVPFRTPAREFLMMREKYSTVICGRGLFKSAQNVSLEFPPNSL